MQWKEWIVFCILGTGFIGGESILNGAEPYVCEAGFPCVEGTEPYVCEPGYPCVEGTEPYACEPGFPRIIEDANIGLVHLFGQFPRQPTVLFCYGIAAGVYQGLPLFSQVIQISFHV